MLTQLVAGSEYQGMCCFPIHFYGSRSSIHAFLCNQIAPSSISMNEVALVVTRGCCTYGSQIQRSLDQPVYQIKYSVFLCYTDKDSWHSLCCCSKTIAFQTQGLITLPCQWDNQPALFPAFQKSCAICFFREVATSDMPWRQQHSALQAQM